jgi:hypothetical protein
MFELDNRPVLLQNLAVAVTEAIEGFAWPAAGAREWLEAIQFSNSIFNHSRELFDICRRIAACSEAVANLFRRETS